MSLGEALAIRYSGSRSHRLKLLIGGIVIFGCAAYQTGNILGAISGISLISGINPQAFTLFLGVSCALILWFGNYQRIALIMGIMVFLMAVTFLSLALKADFSFLQIFEAGFQPSFPDKSGLLIVGLVGTTIVPYNLFLASGISQGQTISEMRFGLTGSILIGGIISGAVLIAGTLMVPPFTFENLYLIMSQQLGQWAGILVGLGLFAAGFTSAITAPLASAITAQSLFGKGDKNWDYDSKNYRLVWVGVLVVGLFFGMLNVKPIPVIIFAQALNGFLLPIIAIFLITIINDPKVMRIGFINGTWANVISLLVIWASLVIGFLNLAKVLLIPFFKEIPDQLLLSGISLISAIIVALTYYHISQVRTKN